LGLSWPRFQERLVALMPARLVSRRVIDQVFAIIRTVTLLHEHQRERWNDGTLEATLNDYQLARELLLQPLRAALCLSGDEEADELRARLGSMPLISTKDIAEAMGHKNKMQTNRLLNQRLLPNGILTQLSDGKGRKGPATFAWADQTGNVLPTAEQIDDWTFPLGNCVTR
jgi:hypothetical protein